MQVKVRNNNVDKALRIFKKKCIPVLFEYREREYYEKPSIAKKRKRAAAAMREKRRQEEQNGTDD